MTTDAVKNLEQQVLALMNYCKQLKQENEQLQERNRTITSKLQKLLAQFKALED
jgi:FtsZ-binding cell division protein ZapB